MLWQNSLSAMLRNIECCDRRDMGCRILLTFIAWTRSLFNGPYNPSVSFPPMWIRCDRASYKLIRHDSRYRSSLSSPCIYRWVFEILTFFTKVLILLLNSHSTTMIYWIWAIKYKETLWISGSALLLNNDGIIEPKCTVTKRISIAWIMEGIKSGSMHCNILLVTSML